MAIVTIEQLEKRFNNGYQALRGVDAKIKTGSFTAILGPSGAGKSTLLRMMNGLETPTSGTVIIEGKQLDTDNLRETRSKVGMIFQHFNLVDRLSVMTNVLTGRLKNRSWLGSVFYLFRKHDLKIAHEALYRVGLTEKAWERADRLSGGQKQRVGIARALAQRPRLILADEPVASLDPVSSEEIMQLLRDICDKDGLTVIVNLHQVELAKRFADRVIGLNAGKIVFDGSPARLDQATLDHIYQQNGGTIDAEQFDAVLANA
jgi:phosphonate transport system ATP-binding protein